MDITTKMKSDWNKRASIDPMYWVEATCWENENDFYESAIKDTNDLLSGLEPFISKTKSVLDIGCGIGRMTEVMSNKFESVFGVDVSGEMIRVGKKRLSHKKNIHLFETDGVSLSLFNDNTFDFVYSFATLPHMPKELINEYFIEISRVLKKGGILKVQLWMGKPNNPDKKDTLTPRVLSENEFNQLYQNSGFELISSYLHEYSDPLLKMHPIWCTFINKQTQPCYSKISTINNNKSTEDDVKTESDLLIYYADKVLKKGNFQKAEKALLYALELNPKSIDAYSMLASIFLERSDMNQAITCLEKAVSQVPEYKEGHFFLKKLYAATKCHENSMEVI